MHPFTPTFLLFLLSVERESGGVQVVRIVDQRLALVMAERAVLTVPED